ncbi:APC family permease [Caballeronia mineralivorans]|jgi:amino acid transporter|uniref:APC family permease n=1 Tax=Caballeronia mineralivorans TaxID=2010198 RepID=UPI0023F19DF4|nr:APC family permease [Caballeronia mineralivorans]MDB5782241.1 amino acid permease [Caballeronia mineralivorans]
MSTQQSTPQSSTQAAPAASGGLRTGTLGFAEVIGQSIANLSPTFTPSINVTAIAALAGAGTWLIYGLSTLGLLLVSMSIIALSSRIASAGSFFIYIARALGPMAGGIAGWGLIAAYVGTAMGVGAAGVMFVQNAFSAWGINIPSWAVYTIFVGLAWFFSARDVKLSSRLSLGIEAASVVIVGGVLIYVLALHPDHIIDHTQLGLQGVSGKGMAQGMVLGIFSYVGFESAASLGQETKNPLRVIPRAVIWSVILSGLFFMFVAYSMTIAYHDDAAKLGADSAVLSTLLTSVGASPLGPVFYLIASISAFSCVLACINSSSRLLYSMGRYQFVHRSMGMVHRTHRTPYLAVAFSSIVTFVVCIAMLGTGPLNTFGYTSTFATFGFLVTYFLVAIAAPIYLKKQGELKTINVVWGVLGALAMVGAVIGSVYPVPDYPYNILPYLFVAYMLVGAIWLLMLKKRSPQVLEKIEHDLETSDVMTHGKK